MATKSQSPVAISSMALRCTSMLSPPSNHVTSTPNHLPHNSAVSLPEAHHVEPSPQFEKAAFSFLPKGRISPAAAPGMPEFDERDRKSTRLNSSHLGISYAVF